MPATYYLQIRVNGQDVDLPSLEDLPVSINYKLEDRVDFQVKESQTALSMRFPATPINDVIFNTFHNPSVIDLTPGESLGSVSQVSLIAGGSELITGKCILDGAEHNSRPLGYQVDIYGGNADWMIDLKEATLHDCVKHINFIFNKDLITASWDFDGNNEDLPYVFAPIRYRQAMDDGDKNMKPEYMKPSISKYWVLYWGFKLAGYRLTSNFFDTEYFRRQVMPWTWGNFLYSDGTQQDVLRFLAKGNGNLYGIEHANFTGGVWPSWVVNDSTDGAFDNNNVYEYDVAGMAMKYTYPAGIPFGTLTHIFHISPYVESTVRSDSVAELRVIWYKNGVEIQNNQLVYIHAGFPGREDFDGNVDDWCEVTLDPGDVVTAKIWLRTVLAPLPFSSNKIYFRIDAFELEYTKVPLGGIVNFENLLGLKKFKFLDILRGVIDEFNLQVQTDAVQKVVYIEPTHPYSLSNDLSDTEGGFLKGDWLSWTDKQDLARTSRLSRLREYERELVFKYKDDTSDGILKKVQDRNQNTLAAGKYVLPERFKSGAKEIENRFFSPVMHYKVEQWKAITGKAPQMVVMVPENISNTSNSEAGNTFSAKSCYYKGLSNDYGWRFDGEDQLSFPFLFAVNYEPGGEADPILSYCEERIGEDGVYVIGKGLLRRFYMQRMANMRDGKQYATFFHLNNADVQNWLHREYIICRDDRWELVEISNYQPLKSESTSVFLRKWSPITTADSNAVFPALLSGLTASPFEMKYARLMCLSFDIPTDE